MLINVNSLVNKFNSIYYLFKDTSIKVICICETWLTPGCPSASVDIPGFIFYRNDSPSGLRKHGVGIYIHHDLYVDRVFSQHPNTFGLHLPKLDLTLLLVYRPPSNSMEDNSELFSYIDSFCNCSELILLGDFNLPSIDWTLNVPPTSFLQTTYF